MDKRTLNLKIIVATLFLLTGLLSCKADVANRVGISSGGFVIGITAIYGNAGLPADGSSQATIRVEVFTTAGQVVNNEQVNITTTLGTLAFIDLDGDEDTAANLTVDGVVLATLTSEETVGTAFVVASVQNVSATTAVPFVQLTGSVN